MRIIIAGDLVPTKNNELLFKKSEIVSNLDNKLKKIWFDSDYRIFNLECVLGNLEILKPIKKHGPNLIASLETINGIKDLKPSLVLLANNHILDFGVKGLNSTLEILKFHNIKYTGIINNKLEKNKFVFFEKDGIKVAIYNLCENEFSVAGKNKKGANGFSYYKNICEIQELKETVDYVIVIFHGGKEFYRYPSPNQRDISHSFIDFGADLIIYQHSHCIGCEEVYKNKKVIYGQGNFVFCTGDDDYWNTELILQVDISNENIDITYHPVQKKDNLIYYSDDKSIIENYFKRSSQIKEEKFIENEYNKFSLNYLNNYLYNLNGKNIINRLMNKLRIKKYFIKKYNLKSLLAIQNIIECEAHRELLINGLKMREKEIVGDEDED